MFRLTLLLFCSLLTTVFSQATTDLTFSFQPENHDSGSGSNSCGSCGEDNLAACTSWVTSLDYVDYSVNNLFCGCADRVTGDSQCFRFLERSVSELESFVIDECGVHIRCEAQDWDAEPDSHDCQERCALLFLGCFAKCDTTCAYLFSCEAITSAVSD